MHEATVTEIQEIAAYIVQVTVALRSDAFRFEPGQWVNLHYPEGVTRAYAIASAPQRPRAVQICIRLGKGEGGVALQRLNVGDEVSLDGPHGHFTIPHGDTCDIVLIAGDTGVAPVRSIVLHLLATGDRRKIIVLYEPDQRQILYARDFDPLARSGKITHESGAIETLIARNEARLGGALVMVAGFEPFLQKAKRAIDDVRVPPAQVITESFGPQPSN